MEQRIASSLTVIIPVTARDGFRLEQTLESLSQQTLIPARIVLIEEDTENEEAHAICREAVFNYDKVCLVTDDRQHRGMDTAINRGIETVKTPLLALLAGGDVATPTFVEKMIDAIGPDTDICVSNAGFTADIDRPLRGVKFGRLLQKGCLDSLRGAVLRKALIEQQMLAFSDRGNLSAISFLLSCLMYCHTLSAVKEKLIKKAEPVKLPSRFIRPTDVDAATAIHTRLLSVTDEGLHQQIYEYTYGHYSRLCERALRANQRSLAAYCLKQKLVRLAYEKHRCRSTAERVRVMLMRNRLFPLLRMAHLFKKFQ